MEIAMSPGICCNSIKPKFVRNAYVVAQVSDLQIGDRLIKFKAGLEVLADFSYGKETDMPFGAFLFAKDGWLAGLEVYSFTDKPAPLPKPEELRPFVHNKSK
jgi:hypothetical protein